MDFSTVLLVIIVIELAFIVQMLANAGFHL